MFVQATIWGINPFDQWGVELGKKIAGETQRILESRQGLAAMDASTRALIEATWAAEESP